MVKNKLPFAISGGFYRDFIWIDLDTEDFRCTLKNLGAERMGGPNRSALYIFGMPGGDCMWSGVGKLDGEYHKGPKLLRRSPKHISGNGVLLEMGARPKIRNSWSGRSPLWSGRGIVTNRLHLAAFLFDELDTAPALAMLHMRNSFSRQPSVLRSPIRGISLALPWQNFEWNGSAMTASGETPKYELLTPNEYRQLIEKAAEEIVENLEAALRTDSSVVAALTGGRDSRVMFAALVAMNRQDEVYFTTSPRDDDVPIATGLIKRYGGQYGNPQPSQGWQKYSISEIDTKRRSHLFGTYTGIDRFGFDSEPVQYPEDVLQIGGAGGECYRPFYGNFSFFEAHTGNSIGGKKIAEILLDHHLWKKNWSHLSENLNDAYAETFDALPGESFEDKLEWHYFVFRNRFHFGHSAGLKNVNKGSLFALESENLLKAAHGLPPRERSKNRVMFDITRVLYPELALHQYDKPWAVNFEESDYYWPVSACATPTPLEPDPDLAAINRHPSAGKTPRPKPHSSQHLTEFYLDGVESSIEEIKYGPCAHILSSSFLESLDYNLRGSRLPKFYFQLRALADYQLFLE